MLTLTSDLDLDLVLLLKFMEYRLPCTLDHIPRK